MTAPIAVNAGVLIALAVSAAMFDATLELGELHGAVFGIFLFYGSALLFVVNAVAAGVFAFRRRRQKAAAVFVAGTVAAAAGWLIAYVGSR